MPVSSPAIPEIWSVATNSSAIGWCYGRRTPRWKSLGNGSSEPAPGNAFMDVLMPQLGETVAEGKITQWFKSAGEPVKTGDNLFEIETDKVSMEVPATTAGVLSEIRVSAGAVVPVGAVVAVIADGTATAANPPRVAASPVKPDAGPVARAAAPA